MPFLLTNLRIDEVSSVNRGAAKGARMVLMKRDTSKNDKAAVCPVCGGLHNEHKENCPMSTEKSAVCKECGGKGNHLEKCSMFAKAWGPDFVHGELTEYEKREFTQEQRDAAARSGAAMPGGGFPIQNAGDLKNAIRAIGRAKDPAAAKAHIKQRARALGLTDQLPDTWKALDPFEPAIRLAHQYGAPIDALATVVAAARKSVQASDADVDRLVAECVDYLASIVPAGSVEAFKAAIAATPAAKKGGAAMTPEEITKLQKRAAFLELLAKASDEIKSFMAAQKMDEAAQAEFLGKSEADQKAAIEKAKKPPPKNDDDNDDDDMGKRLAKSDERIKALEKSNAELVAERELATCKELCRKAGVSEGKAEHLMKLRAVDQKIADDTLKDWSAAAKQSNPKLFEELGKSGSASATASDELQAKALELLNATKKADPTSRITIEKARASIYTDPAYRELAKRVKTEEDARRHGRAAA